LPTDQVVVVEETARTPITREPRCASEPAIEIGRLAATLVPEGAALEVSPGEVGDAVLDALEQPVRLRTGAVTDAAVRLDSRGLLADEPVASYIVGSTRLMEWVDRRAIAAGIDVTHNPTRLGECAPFFAVNSALEIDGLGNVNAQGSSSDVSGGIGGMHDFAAAAARSPWGLSVVALPSERGGRRTLVDELTAPASLPRSLVEVVVTDRGIADLRGLADAERTEALRALWPAGVVG
jgi:acyl-CoA hydrolase